MHHEEPAPGCRIYLMKRDPIAATSMAVTLRNFGYMVSQWHDFAALEQATASRLPDALIVGIEHEGEFDALAALQQGTEQPLPLLVIHDRNDFASQLAAVRAGAGASSSARWTLPSWKTARNAASTASRASPSVC